MSRGRREAVNSGRQRQRVDPFAEEIPYRQTRRPKKKKKSKRGLAIGGTVTLIAILSAVLVGNFFFKKPDVRDNDRPGVSDNSSPDGISSNGTSGDAASPSGRKEDFYTFLLLGRDTGGGGNTDTIILVSYDVPNQQVNMMSIPRDMAVNVSWSTKKINSVYNAKESSGGGVQNLKQQVAYLTGVLPDFYVTIEWKAVGRIVEAVGGIEFDVPRNMNYDDPYQDLHIHLNKGVQKLNGQKAMEMLRYRHDNNASVGYNDSGRMDTQKAFLKAMAKEVLKLKNMTKIGEFIDIFMENVETDLKLSDLTWFASKALGVDTDSIQSSTMPYFDVGTFRGAWYFLPDTAETVKLVNEQFNPYNRDITEDDLRAIVRREDGSCYVTGGGNLLDSSWGKTYSGKTVSSSGGGASADLSTGVTAKPTTETSSGGSQTSSGQNTAKPADKPESSSPSGSDSSGNDSNTGASVDNEPAEVDEPVLPDPDETDSPSEPAGEEAPPMFNPEPDGEPEPVPEPEPELPPEPVLPPDDILMDIPA